MLSAKKLSGFFKRKIKFWEISTREDFPKPTKINEDFHTVFAFTP